MRFVRSAAFFGLLLQLVECRERPDITTRTSNLHSSQTLRKRQGKSLEALASIAKLYPPFRSEETSSNYANTPNAKKLTLWYGPYTIKGRNVSS
jgi:hypothetical protein